MSPPAATLFLNASEVVTCAGPPRARRGAALRDAGIRRGVGVAVAGGLVAAVAEEATLRRDFPHARVIDCAGGVLTPGLVDCHTHALFGRGRHEEHERRALGESYQAIAAAGGGIHASVRDLHARPDEELLARTAARLATVAAAGVTTVEVKSGYGLTTPQEVRSLRLIRELASRQPLRLVPTWLGAHEIPIDARASAASRAAHLRLLVEEQLPAVAGAGLARFADIFCEPGVYTIEESRTLLTAARAAGLELKLHADELEGAGGAELAAELGARSADHLAAISPAGVTALARSDTVAVLLPATMLFLGTGRQAPARRLVEAGAAIALASDLNPGSSPLLDFGLVLTLGVSVLRLSVAEVLLATTVNAAAALGLADRIGQLAPGYSADLALFRASDARELPYWIGERLCSATWIRGEPCHPVTPRPLAESPG